MIKYFCDRCGEEVKREIRYIDVYAYDGLGTPIAYGGCKHICEECGTKLDAIEDKIEHEEDFLNMTDEDIELLRYTFKVGDKVITSDGRTGTITDICHCDKCKKRGFYEPTVEIGNHTDYITISDKESDFVSYYSIGDMVFGNLDEQYVTYQINDAWEKHNRLIKQLGLIKTLKEKGWSANEI